MAKDHWPPGTDVIDVAVALEGRAVASFAVEVAGRVIHGAPGALGHVELAHVLLQPLVARGVEARAPRGVLIDPPASEGTRDILGHVGCRALGVGDHRDLEEVMHDARLATKARGIERKRGSRAV